MIPISKTDKTINGFFFGFVNEITDEGVTDIQALFPDISSLELEQIPFEVSRYSVIFTGWGEKADKFLEKIKLENSYQDIGYCDVEVPENTIYYDVPEEGYIVIPFINEENIEENNESRSSSKEE